MSDRGGILPNSPLLYVLASVRFAPWPLLQAKIPEIHESLREHTPLIHSVQQQLRVIPSIGPQITEASSQVWLIMASDRSYGVQIGADQVLFFSSKYERFANFQEFLNRCLTVLFEHMKFMDVTTTGVRYIDHIKPRSGETLAQYLAPGFLTPPVESFEAAGGASQYVYNKDKSELRVRSIFSKEALAVPPDIIGVLAAIQAGLGKQLTLNTLEDNEMLLDMDSLVNFPQPQRMDLAEITKTLDDLHKRANAFFRHEAVCTDFAFQVWKGGK